MRKILLVLGILAAILLALFLVFITIGLLAPVHFEGSLTKKFSCDQEKLWTTMNDIEGLPKRRKEILRVENLGRNSRGHLTWKEHTDMGGYILFEMLENVTRKRMVVRMNESTFGMTGTWSYDLGGERGECILAITEQSDTLNLFVRSILAIAGRNANLQKEMQLLVEVSN